MINTCKKRPATQVLMSTDVQKDLLIIDRPPNLVTWTYQFWMLCQGSYLSAFLGQIVIFASYACTLRNHPTVFEFFYASAMFVTFSMGGIYQIFWLRCRRSTATLFERLLALTKELEVDFAEKEHQMTKSSRGAMLTVVRGMRIYFAAQVSLLCFGSPVLDVRLPPFMQGMKPFSPGMLALQVLQVCICFPIALTTSEYLTTQSKLIFFLTNGYKIIGRRLRQLDMTHQKKVRDTVRLHSEYMALSEATVKVFSAWNLVYATHFLSIAVISTVGVISGVHEFEIVLLAPAVGYYLYVMCRLGELMKGESSSVANDIYEGHWLNGDGELRKMLVLPILRAQRPVIVRAGLIGPLTLRKFVVLLKQWYSFIQFMLNVKK